MLRYRWARIRDQYLGPALVTVCLSGLTISGCSKGPFGIAADAPKKPAGSLMVEEPSDDEIRREAIARRGRNSEGRVHLSSLGRKRSSARSLSKTASRDPFLASESGGSPAANASQSSLAQSRRSSSGQPASHGRKTPSTPTGTTPHEQVQVAVKPVSSPDKTRPKSRLEQLREQLRMELNQRPQPSKSLAQRGENSSEKRSDRGLLLSGNSQADQEQTATGKPSAEAASRTLSQADGTRDANRTSPLGAQSSEGETEAASSRHDQTAVRLQGFLAAADWQLQEGNLHQAYRNALLAQRIAEREQIQFGPGDRRPSELVAEIWNQIQAQQSGSEYVAANRPRSSALRTVSSHTTEARRAFSNNSLALGWTAVEQPEQEELPVVQPLPRNREARSGDPEPTGIKGEGTSGQPTIVPACPAEKPAGSVTLSGIHVSAVKPRISERTEEITTAHAEFPSQDISAWEQREKSSASQASFITPGMASIPKIEGPSLQGPRLKKLNSEEQPGELVPPPLDLRAGGSQLPMVVTPGAEEHPQGWFWPLAGGVAILLAGISIYRRRFSGGKA